jgi:hypothetical protein
MNTTNESTSNSKTLTIVDVRGMPRKNRAHPKRSKGRCRSKSIIILSHAGAVVLCPVDGDESADPVTALQRANDIAILLLWIRQLSMCNGSVTLLEYFHMY